jgi:cyclophilin family peptidyl-prolyl cis-trans isomerase
VAKGGYQRRRLEAKKHQEKLARKRARRNRVLLSWVIGLAVAGLLATVLTVAFTGTKKPKATTTPSPTPTACTTPSPGLAGKKSFANPPCMFIDPSKTYTATLKTSLGVIKINLLPSAAPTTVNNFVFLAEQKFFDGSLFHRVIPDFGGPGSDMIQGGDAAKRDGTGDAGYKFGDENMIAFDKAGYIAMANSGPGTNGSQFFILDGTVGHLNKPGTCPGPSGCHSVFGQVTQGLDVIKKIAGVKTDPNDNKPVKDVVLIQVTIQQS